MPGIKLYVFLSIICVLTHKIKGDGNVAESKGPPPKHYNIILIGATGDLAQKYLWVGLYDLFQKHYVKDKVQFTIYGCGRKEPDVGRRLMGEILLTKIPCPDEECRKVKTQFIQTIQYHQLKTEKDYKKLGKKINENTQSLYALQNNFTSYEQGRLFYLSIPPSAYAKTTKFIDKYIRPELGRPWVRIVLEKPFGHDSESAKDLAKKIGKHFKEEEVYRIDHYLGKPVVKYILPFRYINKEKYEPVWNRQHVERVEIVMKEALDAKGRISFYDDVGVIRDVMQNHLTEILCLVAMELPENSGSIKDVLQSKVDFLKAVEPLAEGSTVVGQYESYIAEALPELKKLEHESDTPTFAATVMYVNNERWQGVPFILKAGKKLDEKASYVRLVMKGADHCYADGSGCQGPEQIVFYIGGNDPQKKPMVVLSEGLPKPKDSSGWNHDSLDTEAEMFGEKINKMHQLTPSSNIEAYTALISSVFDGERSLFVNGESLLASWDVWTPCLDQLKRQQPRLYRGGQNGVDILDFHIDGKSLVYDKDSQETERKEDTPISIDLPDTFRGHKLVSGQIDSVVETLVNDFKRLAKAAIKKNGVFHCAFSGGSSPPPFFNQLVETKSDLKWESIHVWFVDERCVPHNDKRSNFENIRRNFVSQVPIPDANVHPMMVELNNGLCNPQDEGDKSYQESLEKHVPGKQLDFILLGVGADGHTASLFPNQNSLSVTDNLVIYAEGGSEDTSTRRLTLTYAAINEASYVSVLITGKAKRNVVVQLSDQNVEPLDLPIVGVKPSKGKLVWYIDIEAL